jgi:hypothetical protein
VVESAVFAIVRFSRLSPAANDPATDVEPLESRAVSLCNLRSAKQDGRSASMI